MHSISSVHSSLHTATDLTPVMDGAQVNNAASKYLPLLHSLVQLSSVLRNCQCFRVPLTVHSVSWISQFQGVATQGSPCPRRATEGGQRRCTKRACRGFHSLPPQARHCFHIHYHHTFTHKQVPKKNEVIVYTTTARSFLCNSLLTL